MPAIQPNQEIEAPTVKVIAEVGGYDYTKPSVTAPSKTDIPILAPPVVPETENIEDDNEVSTRTPYRGVKVTFLNGTHSGKVLNLGTDVVSVSQSQTANWEEKTGQKMRVGINFKNVSPRSISFKLDLYNSNRDISPLVENIAHLQEIDEELAQPPYTRIEMGGTAYDFAVCTSYSPEYTLPLPENRGLRRAVVSLEFKIAGGVGSVYQSATPFSENTPLKRLAEARTAEEKSKQGSLPAVEVLMSECLSTEEDSILNQALVDETLDDIDTYINLPSNLFLQLAMAGLPETIVELPQFQTRLKGELALAIAKTAPSSDFTPNQIAESIFNGTPLVDFPGGTQDLIIEYSDIFSSIVNGSTKSLKSAAGNRANKIAKCGRKLNVAGGLTGVAIQQKENPAFAIANLNKSLSSVTNLSQQKKILGFGRNVSNESVKAIVGSAPFETKEDFISAVKDATGEGGGAAYSALANVKARDDDTLRELNIFLGDAEADDIKERLGLKDDEAAALVGGNYISKEEFSKALFRIKNADGEYTFDAGLSDSQEPWKKFADKIGKN